MSQVRYAINCDGHSVRKYAIDQKMEVTRDIPHNNNIPIYLDILEKTQLSYKVKMYFVSGETIVGYIAHKPFNPIVLTNSDSLLDGRFNS